MSAAAVTAAPLLRQLAAQLDCVVVSVDYAAAAAWVRACRRGAHAVVSCRT